VSAHFEPARPGKAASVLRAGASWVAGVPCRALIALVRLYRLVLSPWLGSACRFEPTCSRYAIDAVRYRGPLVGPVLAVWRLLRCNPWNDGGVDPVRRTR